jgi:hypothetical protein
MDLEWHLRPRFDEGDSRIDETAAYFGQEERSDRLLWTRRSAALRPTRMAVRLGKNVDKIFIDFRGVKNVKLP